MAQRWEFGVLGPLAVWCDGSAVAIQRGNQRVVLALLLLNLGRVVSVDEIAMTLWGNRPPPSAEPTIRNYVKRIRQALGDAGRAVLHTRPPGYVIDLDPVQLDLARFEVSLQAARTAARSGSWASAAGHARAALALWRGEPLADLGTETMARLERPRLCELRLRALEVRLDADLALARHDDVTAELERLVADHPLRERFHAQLMTALYRGARQADALAAYRRVRRVLVAELGSEPGDELQRIHRAILTADPSLSLVPAETHGGPASRRPAQLPADVAGFTGRDADVARLVGLLRDRAVPVRIAAVTGAGGLGKSALAVHVAHQVRDEFPDGQLYIELQGSQQHAYDATEVLARVLRHLGVPDAAIPKDEAELAAEFRTYVADLRLLIVLDDARDAAQIRPLLPGTSASAVLVTSRNRLPDLQGGTVFALEPLAGPEAAELFALVCGADRVAAEPAATDLVLGACGGLPLAIWVAAARLASRPGWDIGTLADQLTDERRRLDALQVGDLAVRTTFWISYSTLPEAVEPDGDVARAFRLLGLWPGADISLPAAAALLGTRSDQAFRLLDRLVDSQLLLAPAPGRYRFHDLIRVFAAEQALAGESPVDRAAAIRRVLLWFLHSADHAYDLLSPGARERVVSLIPAGPDLVPATFTGYDAAAEWSDVERANLVAAVALASRQGEHRICAQLVGVTWSSFMRSPWAGWADALRTGIDSAAAAGAPDDQAWLLNFLGVVHLYGDDMVAARSVLEPALVLSRQAGDRLCEGVVTAHLAIMCKELKQYDRAVAYFREAERHLHATGSRQAARIMMNLGMLLLEVGRPAEAAGRMERALASMCDLGDVALESLARSHLAEAYRQLGRCEEALGLARAALELSRAVRDRYQESAALLTLGLVLADRGEYGPAREALTDARTLTVALELPQAVLAGDALAALDRRP